MVASADDDLGPAVRSIVIAMLVMSWTAVALRTYVRVFIVKSFGVDDWFIAVTLISFTVGMSLSFVGLNYGIGRHLISLPSIGHLQKGMMYWLLLAINYTVTMTLLKVSICLFLLRIASQLWHRWVLYIIMAISVVFGLFFAFLLVFQCHPVHNFWNVLQPNCLPQQVMIIITITHGSIMAAGDWTCAILPIFLVWDLHMNRRMKITVALILMVGALGSIATIIRIYFVWKVSRSKTDVLYVTANVTIWSTIEPAMGITAVSLATLRPLFRKLLDSTIGLSSNLGSSKESRSRSRQQMQVENVPDAGLTGGVEIKMDRVQSKARSENSDSSGIVYGGVPRDHLLTTTVRGQEVQKRGDCALTKIQKKLSQREDEMPIVPMIYKRSEFSSYRESIGQAV